MLEVRGLIKVSLPKYGKSQKQNKKLLKIPIQVIIYTLE